MAEQQRTPSLGIGVIGCGNVSLTYLRNAALFRGIHLVACADLSASLAAQRASEYRLSAQSVDELLANPDVDLVLNLTIPSAHADISMSALSAGKHVFTEKPLATTLEAGRTLLREAQARGLSLGSAPDTFLGAAGRQARRWIDEGIIGKPVTGTAFMLGRGMEHWHPNPAFYYQPGGGPLFDMGPYYLTMLVNLLGPVKNVSAMATQGQNERLITADGPLNNTTFPVGTPTTIQSLLEFHNGAVIQFGTSWDVFQHSCQPLEIHGTEGSLQLPDPDTFGGVLKRSDRGAPWEAVDTASSVLGQPNWPYDQPDRANYRMLGVADLADGLQNQRAARASGELMLHVLDIMETLLEAAASRRALPIHSAANQPQPLSEEAVLTLLA